MSFLTEGHSNGTGNYYDVKSLEVTEGEGLVTYSSNKWHFIIINEAPSDVNTLLDGSTNPR